MGIVLILGIIFAVSCFSGSLLVALLVNIGLMEVPFDCKWLSAIIVNPTIRRSIIDVTSMEVPAAPLQIALQLDAKTTTQVVGDAVDSEISRQKILEHYISFLNDRSGLFDTLAAYVLDQWRSGTLWHSHIAKVKYDKPLEMFSSARSSNLFIRESLVSACRAYLDNSSVDEIEEQIVARSSVSSFDLATFATSSVVLILSLPVSTYSRANQLDYAFESAFAEDRIVVVRTQKKAAATSADDASLDSAVLIGGYYREYCPGK